jgi:hypothetical protein
MAARRMHTRTFFRRNTIVADVKVGTNPEGDEDARFIHEVLGVASTEDAIQALARIVRVYRWLLDLRFEIELDRDVTAARDVDHTLGHFQGALGVVCHSGTDLHEVDGAREAHERWAKSAWDAYQARSPRSASQGSVTA